MTSPGSNAYKDTYRNVLRYTGQNYRFVPTFLRQRDPASPTSESTDVKPFEMQGYYPVNSLWTNTTNKNVWLLRGISNGKGDWVLISGGAGGLPVIQTDNVIVPPLVDTFTFVSPNISITGNAVTGTVTFNALQVLNQLEFGVDFTAAGALNGSVFPVNQKVYIKGNDAVFGTYGITTQALQTDFADDTVFIKYAEGTVTTINAVPTIVFAFQTKLNESNTVQIHVVGRDVATGKTFGGRAVFVVANVANVVTIQTLIEKISGGSAPMNACNFTLAVLGTQLQVAVVGLAATTINWRTLVPVIASITN